MEHPRQNGHAEEDKKIDEKLGKIKNLFLVMSGKGGVGKSTVAVNLAVSLMNKGYKTGLMDIDLHGPNTLKMLGMEGQKMAVLEDQIMPLQYKQNLKVVSISSFLDGPETAVIWRGPLKIGVIKQFIGDVTWGDLDYLVIDSPPGTGDEPLTVAQSFKGAKSIIITTPQEVSLLDVSKSITFCRQVSMPVIGLIENMSRFSCPHCGKEINIFPEGGTENLAKKSDCSFLGSIPMQPEIAASSDSGRPFAGSDSQQTDIGRNFEQIVDNIIKS